MVIKYFKNRLHLPLLFIYVFLGYIFFSGIDSVLFAQADSTEMLEELREDKFEEMINAITDSALNYLYFDEDSLSVFFPVMSMFNSWDTVGLFHKKADFSHKADTTTLILKYAEDAGYSQPVPGKVNSEFGWRRKRFHYGIDLALQIGDTVKASFDGVVRITRYHRGYGNVVVVRHFNGLETTYAHLSKILVYQNQSVTAGDLLGLGGSTGRSTGPHLHFELRYMGAPFNPRDAIDFEGGRLKSDTLMLTAANFCYSKMRSARAISPGGKQRAGYYGGSKYAKKAYYTVRKGDTLGSIAAKNRTTVKTLCRLNGIKSTTILKVGKKLRIR